MERWLSWSKAHDWKSCVDLNSTGGSNPPLSARKGHPIGCPFCFVSVGSALSGNRGIPEKYKLRYAESTQFILKQNMQHEKTQVA